MDPIRTASRNKSTASIDNPSTEASTITNKQKRESVLNERISSLAFPSQESRSSISMRRLSLTNSDSRLSLTKINLELVADICPNLKKTSKSSISLVADYNADELMNQGVLLHKRTNLDDADAKWRQAFDQAVNCDDIFNQARSLSNQACLAKQRGSLECSGKFLYHAWTAFVEFYCDSIAKHSVPGRWLDVITDSFDILNTISFYSTTGESNSTAYKTPSVSSKALSSVEAQRDKSQGPPIVILLLEIISNIGIYLLEVGKYDASRVWLDYGLSLCGNVFIAFPLPAPSLSKFILKCIPAARAGLEDFNMSIDQLLDASVRPKFSVFHKSVLGSLTRLLSTSGVTFMQLGQLNNSNDHHRNALDVVHFYSQSSMNTSSKRLSSLPQTKDIVNYHEASVLSNWASLRMHKLDLGNTLQLCLLSKFKYIDCGDSLNILKQESNISCVMIRLMTDLVRWGVILGTTVVDASFVDRAVLMHCYKIDEMLATCEANKDWIGRAFYLIQLASLFKTIGNPMESLKTLARINISVQIPNYITDAVRVLLQSIAMLSNRGPETYVPRDSSVYPGTASLIDEHLGAKASSTSSSSTHLLDMELLTQLMNAYTIEESPHGISHTDIDHSKLLGTLVLLNSSHRSLVSNGPSLASSGQRKDKNAMLLANDVLKLGIAKSESDIARHFNIKLEGGLLMTLLHFDLNQLPRVELIHLVDVYLHLIESLMHQESAGLRDSSTVLKKLRHKASLCLLMSLSISENGMIQLIKWLSSDMNEEVTLEVLNTLQNNPFQ